MSAVDGILIIALSALVAVLFVLAMVEASLLHVRRSAVAVHASDGDQQSQRLLALLDELPTVMNSVLLAVLLSQVSATTIAGVLAQRWLGNTGITIATVAVTVVLFIYGEAIPKTIAIADPVRYARRFSGLVHVMHVLLGPIVSVLVRIAKWQVPSIDRVNMAGVVSERELLHLTDEAEEAGEIDESDGELIEKSFMFGDLRVDDIVIPISEVVSVEASTPVESALRTAIDAGHRRLVVYDDRPDQIIGFVRLRELADASSANVRSTAEAHIRSALTVDRETLVFDLLREMQRTRCHLAVVTTADDETVGIVTVEDIVVAFLGAIDEPDP